MKLNSNVQAQCSRFQFTSFCVLCAHYNATITDTLRENIENSTYLQGGQGQVRLLGSLAMLKIIQMTLNPDSLEKKYRKQYVLICIEENKLYRWCLGQGYYPSL